MRNTRVITSCALLTGLSFAQSQVSFAGWSGQMNGFGYGRDAANVINSRGIPTTTASALMIGPTATARTSLSSSSIAGSAGYIWRASTFATGGERTDNAALQNLSITPQANAFLNVESSVQDNGDGTSKIIFSGSASGGTALLVRALEWDPINGALPTEEELQMFADGDFNAAEFPNGSGHFLPNLPGPVIGSGSGDEVLPISLTLDIPVPFNQIPNEVPPGPVIFDTSSAVENIFLFIDAEALSPVPDSGAYLATFGLTVCGMLMARRSMRQNNVA